MPFDISLLRVAENSRSLLKPKKQWKIQHNIPTRADSGRLEEIYFQTTLKCVWKGNMSMFYFIFAHDPCLSPRHFSSHAPLICRLFHRFMLLLFFNMAWIRGRGKVRELSEKSMKYFFLLPTLIQSISTDYTRKARRTFFVQRCFFFVLKRDEIKGIRWNFLCEITKQHPASNNQESRVT